MLGCGGCGGLLEQLPLFLAAILSAAGALWLWCKCHVYGFLNREKVD